MRPFARLQTTPHILTEASNLLAREDEHLALADLLLDPTHAPRELGVQARTIVERPEYRYLGFADGAIVSVAADAGLVLSDDGPLVAAILAAKGDALHFDAVRRLA